MIYSNIGTFFCNSDIFWTAAEVFSDMAEWSSIPKSVAKRLQDNLSGDLVQQSYNSYLAGTVGIDAMTAVASLVITLAEETKEDLLEYPTPQAAKVLGTMLFLLKSDMSSLTFDFWEFFAIGCIEMGLRGHRRIEICIQQALTITIEKMYWRDDLDHDEWTAYRTDVVELLNALSRALKPDTLTTITTNYMKIAASKVEIQEKVVVRSVALRIKFISRSWKPSCFS